MPKVKKLIDTGCTDVVVTDDGRAIIQPKAECTEGLKPEEVAKQMDEIADSINETLYVKGNRPLFVKVKEGEELKI